MKLSNPFLLLYGGGNEGGGAEYLQILLRSLNRQEFHPTFASMGRDDLGDAVRSLGVEYHVAGSPLAVMRLARAGGARFLHTHGVRANFVGRWAGVLRRLPVITTVHSMIARDYLSSAMRMAATLMDNVTLPLTDRVIAVSEAVARDVIRRGARKDRVRVVYNGITPPPEGDRGALRRDLGLAPDAFTIFSAARLHPVKGLEYLLRAVALAGDRIPSWRLLIAGDGPLRRELEELTGTLGLSERVRFLGQVPAARRLLPACDLYISPSIMEALGISILEAMSAGVPVVATAVGGVTEFLTDGQNGLLVPPGDPKALGDAAARVAQDRDLASRLARAAFETYERQFSVEQFARRTEAVYREVLV